MKKGDGGTLETGDKAQVSKNLGAGSRLETSKISADHQQRMDCNEGAAWKGSYL